MTVTVEILKVAGLLRQRGRFIRAMAHTALTLDLDPSALAQVISFETAGTFDPSIRAGGNPAGAVGLIQFTTRAAREVGTTKDQLAQMTQLEQLEFVERYFRRVSELYPSHPPRSEWRPVDHYLAVFAPAAVGKPDDYAIYVEPSAAYRGNAALDTDGDGGIEVGEIKERFNRLLKEASDRGTFTVDLVGPFGRFAPIVALGALGALAVREL